MRWFYLTDAIGHHIVICNICQITLWRLPDKIISLLIYVFQRGTNCLPFISPNGQSGKTRHNMLYHTQTTKHKHDRHNEHCPWIPDSLRIPLTLCEIHNSYTYHPGHKEQTAAYSWYKHKEILSQNGVRGLQCHYWTYDGRAEFLHKSCKIDYHSLYLTHDWQIC
jgi:hypothetical protein